MTVLNKKEPALVMTRTFQAPKALVFKAWTDPAQLGQWWGPEGFTSPVCELDVRVAGRMLIHMRGPDGTVYPMNGEYKEIVEGERLVFTACALDDEQKPLFENLNIVTFEESDGKTTIHLEVHTLEIFDPTAAQHLAGMLEGWKQTFDRLSRFVA